MISKPLPPLVKVCQKHKEKDTTYLGMYQGAFHVKPTPKVRRALSFRTPVIFREREAAII